MKERITKLQRWLDVIAYLVTRRTPATFEDIAEHVPSYRDWQNDDEKKREAVRRMFERDKDELRKAGIPLKTVIFSMNFGLDPEIEGYAIDSRDFYLPYLDLVTRASAEQSRTRTVRRNLDTVGLSAADATLALEGLRRVASVPSSPLAREARSAFRKLAFDLDPDAFSPDSPVLFVESPGTGEMLQHLRVVSDALLAHKRVTFRYHGMYRGEETTRDVEPYGLLFQEGHWYLVGNDRTRNGVRIFRVGRMDAVKANPNAPHTPDYEVPKDFRLNDFVGRKPWELGEPDEPAMIADIGFRFPLSLWADRNEQGTLVETRADGSSVRRFKVVQVNAFLRWLLGLGKEAEVLEPPELKEQLRDLAKRIAELHGGADG